MDCNHVDITHKLNIVGRHVYWLKHYDPTTGIVELGNPRGTNPLITPKPMTIAQLSELMVVGVVATEKTP